MQSYWQLPSFCEYSNNITEIYIICDCDVAPQIYIFMLILISILSYLETVSVKGYSLSFGKSFAVWHCHCIQLMARGL